MLKKLGLFLGVALFFGLVIFQLTKFKLIAAGDISWFLNPSFLDRRFVWSKINHGYYYPVNDWLPLGAFYAFFQWLGLDLVVIENLYWLFLYLGSFFSFYYLASKLFPRYHWSINFFASFFYVLNPFRIVTSFQDRFWPISVFWPLVFVFYYQLLKTEKLKYVFLIALVSLGLAGPSLNPPAISVVPLSLLLYLLVVSLTRRLTLKKLFVFFKLHLFLLVLVGLFNFWWIPTFISSTFSLAGAASEATPFRPMKIGFFFDHLRLIGQWGWYGGHYL
ncbi:MAG: hypothetical protein JW991_05640, partial [Candidatus Pacebacteria bacterium]|nr:hypothetical protein [Candidatus Paceibacterota bacterium]